MRAEFAIACEQDDTAIRRLLRENPLQGGIALSFEREPCFFADATLPDEEKQTIIARLDGRIVCVGSCSIRQRFVNGHPRRVGYLGGLRLDAKHAGRVDILLGGYQMFRELQHTNPPDFMFTSISSDNERARRFLERGLPGMPRYEFIGEYVTMLIHSRNRKRAASQWSVLQASSAASISGLVDDRYSRYQFAPCWSRDGFSALEPLGLRARDFLVTNSSGRTTACAALWDQRSFKQTVVQGYAPQLSRVRTLINLGARLTGRPLLPPVGTALAHATVSHVALEPNEPNTLVECVAALRRCAAARHIDSLSLGLAAGDPRLTFIRAHFRHREYRSRMYVVHWPETGRSAAELDDLVLQPELAWL